MNLIKSTGTFSFFTIISRVLGYLRDFFIAIFLGTGFLADVFFVAFRIPNTFRRLLSEGTFNAAFVPSYASELVKGKKQSNKFANQVLNILLISLLVIVLIVQLFMPTFVSLIAPGFSDDKEKIDFAINLTRITFPFLFFVSLSSFFSAILNSHNKFAAASAAPLPWLPDFLYFGCLDRENLCTKSMTISQMVLDIAPNYYPLKLVASRWIRTTILKQVDGQLSPAH